MNGKSKVISGKLKLKNHKSNYISKPLKYIISKDIKMQENFVLNEVHNSIIITSLDDASTETQSENKTNTKYYYDNRTETEKKFDEIRLGRIDQMIEKKKDMTFKQRIDKFSNYLSKLPEHYDIPKVGPG